MDGQSVTGEKDVDVSAPDQIAEVHSAARVDDDRAGDDSNAIAGAPGLLHHRGDACDADLDAPLRGDLVGHEREAETIARLKFRENLDAVHAAHHRVAGPNLAQLAAERAARLRTARFGARAFFDDDGRVHALALHGNPLAAAADERLVIRGGVEVFRRAAVAIRRDGVRVLRAGDAAAEPHELREQLRQYLVARSGDAHRHERRFLVRAADPELEHFERAVVAHDGVEHRIKELRVDEMAFGFDHLGSVVGRHPESLNHKAHKDHTENRSSVLFVIFVVRCS